MGYGAGLRLPDNNISNTLVAGGNLTLKNGAVAGDVRYGGSYSHEGFYAPSRGTVEPGTPINFATEFDKLRCLSSKLAEQPSNGNTDAQSYGVTMTGSTRASTGAGATGGATGAGAGSVFGGTETFSITFSDFFAALAAPLTGHSTGLGAPSPTGAAVTGFLGATLRTAGARREAGFLMGAFAKTCS